MQDKLGALKAVTSTGPDSVALDVAGESGDEDKLVKAGGSMEMTAKDNSGFSSGSFMQEFFHEVEVVKEGIKAVKEATSRIQDIAEDSLMAVSEKAEAELSKELEPIIAAANKRAKQTKEILKQMKDETDQRKEQMKPSEVRIRENLCTTLTKKFVNTVKEYQNQQNKYKSDIKKKVKRQLQIVKPDASEEEIDGIMNDGSTNVGDVYRAAILKGAADPIKNAYNDVADKYQDVLRLEQSVAELHQMFLDFALLTEQQGELLDQIEYQVKSAAEYVEDANVDMEYAIDYQKTIRKRQCCIIVIVLVILGIGVGVIYGVITLNGGGGD